MTEPVIRSIPLHRLELSPANVRKTDAGKSAFAELKASIATLDVLENLVVRDVGPGEDPGTDPGQAPGERFAVIAGARRLAALNELAAEGVIEATHPVPCRIVTNGAARRRDLARRERGQGRHGTRPIRSRAFGALALAGATVADIAARFGVSERIVEQRLRLGHAAPELAGRLPGERHRPGHPQGLRRHHRHTARPDGGVGAGQGPGLPAHRLADQAHAHRGPHPRRRRARARYVGIDAYEAAGGPVLRDLFADE